MKKLIIIAFVGLISACSVTKDQYETAEKVCEPHGGVKYIMGTTISSVIVGVTCEDGTSIETSVSRIKKNNTKGFIQRHEQGNG